MQHQLILLHTDKCKCSNTREAAINNKEQNKFHTGRHSQIILPETKCIIITGIHNIIIPKTQAVVITTGASGDKF